jgi:hypothetical protein
LFQVELLEHYKHALDQFLPPEYSEVVCTGSNNDSKLLKEFHLDPKKERQIRKSFGKLGPDAEDSDRDGEAANRLRSGAPGFPEEGPRAGA